MQNRQETLWREALRLEINNAQGFQSADKVKNLCRAYAKLGLEEEALHLANRSSYCGIESMEMLPYMLEFLLTRDDISKLSHFVNIALKSNDRPITVRRSLARALTLLGRLELAADEWRVLLEQNAIEKVDWMALAHFVARHGEVSELGRILIERNSTVLNNPSVPNESSANTIEDIDCDVVNLKLFCILCTRIDRDKTMAKDMLAGLSPESIPDPELTLHLAILAFRLGDYIFAARAARHALDERPELSVAKEIVRTSRSFMRAESVTGKNITVTTPVWNAIWRVGRYAPLNKYVWGVVMDSDNSNPKACIQPLGNPAERQLNYGQTDNIAATFSVLPKEMPDPLEVLPYLDWEVPHVMLQRAKMALVGHAFIGMAGHQEWSWNEVGIKTISTKAALHGPGNPDNALLCDVLTELKERDV